MALTVCLHGYMMYMCRSEVLIWSNGVFRLDHTFLTTRATDVVFLSQGPYLVVTSSTVGVAVLVRSEGGAFIHNYTLSSQPAVKVERVGGAAGSVVIITYSNAPAQLYTFSAGVGSAIATPISVSLRLDVRIRLLQLIWGVAWHTAILFSSYADVSYTTILLVY